MIQIKENICETTNKHYFYTDTSFRNVISNNNMDFYDDQYFYRKQIESALYFRNITKINEFGEILCQYFNKVHKN